MKKTAAKAVAQQQAKAKVAAKAIASTDTKKTAPAKAATPQTSTKPVATKPVTIKTSSTTETPVTADQTTHKHARAAATRDNKAKGIVAKENSVKSAATKSVADETSAATSEGRPAIKSLSGVKTSAAAFFAARQKMAPGKAPMRPVEPKVAEKPIDVKPVDATGPATTLDKAPESGISDSAKGLTPVMDVPKAASDTSTAIGVVKPAVKAPLPKGQGFKTLEYIVYPAHGVGQITAIEEQEVAGYKLELFVISFVKDKMILKVPLPKIASVGMRKLAEAPVVKRALDTLMGRARIKRTMWSRRAQEYEAKINSGDLVAIAEVVRDLYRSDAQPEQSYSERQLYEAALDRMAREIAVVQKLTDAEALKLIDDQLQKGPRRTKVEETEADEAEESDDSKIGEAA